MARIARIVAKDIPHHVTQRGNRKMPVFFSDNDYLLYLTLLDEWAKKAELDLWSFCLIPNHIHLIAVPLQEKSLHLALRETHRRYSSYINQREGWSGYLWQGRFSSYPMDESHTYNAIQYVEDNPVRACLAKSKTDWRWSSASLRNNPSDLPLSLTEYPAKYHCDDSEPCDPAVFQKHANTGRPLGNASFIAMLETTCGRVLTPQKSGRKKQSN